MVSSLTLPQILSQPFAAEGDKNIIPNDATGTQNASLQEGFPEITQKTIESGGIPPVRKDFNGALNLMSQFYFFNQNGGTYTFNSTVSDAIGGYPLNAVLWYFGADGTKSMVTSNLPNNSYNFITNPDYIGDSTKPWSLVAIEKSNLPLGSIVWFDSPNSTLGLEPLNNPNYGRGKILENASNNYPDFWEFCLSRKNLALNDPTYSRYNHTDIEYENELSSKGFCGWYVINEINNTIRLPYYGQAFLQGYTSGDVDKQAGLPNITGRAGYGIYGANIDGAFYPTDPQPVYSSGGGRADYTASFNAARSNPIYGRSSTVQPDSIGIYYYIVTTKTSSSGGGGTGSSTIKISNVVVSPSLFVSDATYMEYPYVASIPINDVTADYVSTVIFNVEEALSGNFAPVSETGAAIVKIWAKEIPSSNITIPTIVLQ